MTDQWGICRECQWWQIEPNASIENPTMGLCIEEELLKFRLRVSGNSGCNQFKEGTPARAEGSSEQSPKATRECLADKPHHGWVPGTSADATAETSSIHARITRGIRMLSDDPAYRPLLSRLWWATRNNDEEVSAGGISGQC